LRHSCFELHPSNQCCTLFPYTTLFRSPKVFELSVVRPNLSYEVAYEEAKTPRLTRYFNRNPQTGIIYCSARKRTVELAHELEQRDRKSTGLNSSHVKISYAVFCLRKKT